MPAFKTTQLGWFKQALLVEGEGHRKGGSLVARPHSKVGGRISLLEEPHTIIWKFFIDQWLKDPVNIHVGLYLLLL